MPDSGPLSRELRAAMASGHEVWIVQLLELYRRRPHAKHGRGFIMGNTAEAILEQIECPVPAIKPPGFVTPVVLKD